MTSSKKEHWNKKYADSPITQLGWYEPKPLPSMQLIENCAVPKNSPIIDIGSGTSTLISNLLGRGYESIIAVDISDVALEKAKALLRKEQKTKVDWIVDDIANPTSTHLLHNVAIWHDRAVFHFLVDEHDRQSYLSVVEKVVMKSGFVVIATFAMEGATHCSGLPVKRYSAESLSGFFGNAFRLIENFDYVYKMPSGDLRPYVYARFQKL
jgi:EEF1A lysine methyltransferase 2